MSQGIYSLAGSLAGSLVGSLAGFLAGFLVGSLAGSLAGDAPAILCGYHCLKNLATVCTSLSPRPEQFMTMRGLPSNWGQRVSR